VQTVWRTDQSISVTQRCSRDLPSGPGPWRRGSSTSLGARRSRWTGRRPRSRRGAWASGSEGAGPAGPPAPTAAPRCATITPRPFRIQGGRRSGEQLQKGWVRAISLRQIYLPFEQFSFLNKPFASSHNCYLSCIWRRRRKGMALVWILSEFNFPRFFSQGPSAK